MLYSAAYCGDVPRPITEFIRDVRRPRRCELLLSVDHTSPRRETLSHHRDTASVLRSLL